jgi:hypothetical protein
MRRRAAALSGRLRGVQILLPAKEGDVRVTTAFTRLLRLPGAAVINVSFGGEGVIVTVRLRRRRRVCGCCGQTSGLEIHDRRPKRWRHPDLGAPSPEPRAALLQVDSCVLPGRLPSLSIPGTTFGQDPLAVHSERLERSTR